LIWLFGLYGLNKSNLNLQNIFDILSLFGKTGSRVK